MFKALKKGIIYLAFLAITTILMLELTYRCYFIDFYKGHLNGLNTKESLLATDQPTILIIGDSFSADKDSYVKNLRDSLPSFRVINSAIPGTSIQQHALMLQDRITRFKSDIFLYQIYVGNDLLEFRHPVNSPDISWARKFYWWLSDQLLIIPFINSRLPQLRQAIYHDLPVKTDPKFLENFTPEQYSSRTKMYFRAEPKILENTILLKQDRKKDMESFVHLLNISLNNVAEDCKVVLLVMPHCIQINKQYELNMTEIGAVVSNNSHLTQLNYPFIKYLEDHLKLEDILIVNPLERLQKEDLIAPVYYGNDPHLNPRGQNIVGQYLLEILDSRILVNAE